MDSGLAGAKIQQPPIGEFGEGVAITPEWTAAPKNDHDSAVVAAPQGHVFNSEKSRKLLDDQLSSQSRHADSTHHGAIKDIHDHGICNLHNLLRFSNTFK